MDLNEKLSDHFSFGELTITDHRDLIDTNRVLAGNFIGNGRALAALLEQVRTLLGVPVVIHSGFRCPELNEAIGGAPHSQHVFFEAADTVYPGLGLHEAYNRIAFNTAGIVFGQIIMEFDSWVHVSIPDSVRYLGNMVGQRLRTVTNQGKTVYETITEPIV